MNMNICGPKRCCNCFDITEGEPGDFCVKCDPAFNLDQGDKEENAAKRLLKSMKDLAIYMSFQQRPYNVKGSTPDRPAMCDYCLCVGWHMPHCREERVEVPKRENKDRIQ